jgi:hypothetical protein
VPPLTAIPTEMGRNRGVSDPGWVRVCCPRAPFRVAHASIPCDQFVLEISGGNTVRSRACVRGARWPRAQWF